MNEKFKYLFKNVILFMFGNFIPKILSFILIPLYTYCLTTSEYGISDLIISTANLLVPIFTLDIQDAVLRFVMDDKYKKSDVFTVAMKINLIGFVLVTLFTIISFVFLNDQYELYVFVFLAIFYFTAALSNSLTLFCKGIDKVNVIVKSTIINSVLTLSLNILFLVIFKMNLVGYLLANSIGSIVSIIYTFIKTNAISYIKNVENKKIYKEMIKFSFPLIFSVIAWWINNVSDRYILTAILGVSASGLYAVAYKIPNILSMLQNVFSQAWSISAIKEFDSNDTDGFIGKMYTTLNFIMCLGCSFIMIINVFVAKILFSNDFFEAWKFVPPLLVSVVFNSLALFIGNIFTAAKKTKILSISTIIGAIINTILNIILIKKIGIYGAAIATLIGYLVVFISRRILLNSIIKIKTNEIKNYILYVLLIVQMAIAYFGNKYIIFQIAILLSIFILYINNINNIFKYLKEKLLKNKKKSF